MTHPFLQEQERAARALVAAILPFCRDSREDIAARAAGAALNYTGDPLGSLWGAERDATDAWAAQALRAWLISHGKQNTPSDWRALVIETRANFVCAICERPQNMRWERHRRGADAILPPLCRYCESAYSHGKGKADGGSFRDRRLARQLWALAEALHVEAAHAS